MTKHYKIGFFTCLITISFALMSEDTTIPVVFVQWTDTPYLPHTLWQAKEFNKRVILIGDAHNKHHALELGLEYYDIDQFNTDANYFESIYVHLSGKPKDIVLMQFKRWFILDEFMRKQNIPIAFQAESDVMLYCDIHKEYVHFKDGDMALLRSNAGQTSYWKPKAIHAVCNFIKQFYENKEKIAQLSKEFDIRNDRTFYHDDVPLFELFLQQNKTFKVKDLCQVIDNATFDYAMASEDQHAEEEGKRTTYYYRITWISHGNGLPAKIKDIKIEDDAPFCYCTNLNKWVRFKSMHFVGWHKEFISRYRIPNPKKIANHRN